MGRIETNGGYPDGDGQPGGSTGEGAALFGNVNPAGIDGGWEYQSARRRKPFDS